MGFFSNFSNSFSQSVKKYLNYQTIPDPNAGAPQSLKSFGYQNFAGFNQRSNFNSEMDKNQLILKFFEVNKTKEDIYKEIDNIKDFYLVDLMISRILDDALNVTGSDQNIFSVSILNEDTEDILLTKYIKEFLSAFNIRKIIVDIAYDLLLYGEHCLRLDLANFRDKDVSKIGNGIINIHDDVDLTNVIPVYKDSDIDYFLVKNENGFNIVQPSQYVFFSLNTSRIKVQTNASETKVLYYRIGKSLIYPILGLLKELKLLEFLVPSKFINDALSPSILTVSVPSVSKPEETIEIVRVYEKMLNDTLKMDSNRDDINEMIRILSERIGIVKVIPNFGSEKGDIQKTEFNKSEDFGDINTKILDLRKTILTTVGIPSVILDEVSSRGETIKNYSRYSKKLKSFQQVIKEGIQQLILIHLTNSGYLNKTKDDISIKFTNIVNSDDLEKLEMLDLTVSMMSNFRDFFSSLSELEDKGIKVKYENYANFLSKNIFAISGYELIEYQTPTFIDDTGGDGGDGEDFDTEDTGEDTGGDTGDTGDDFGDEDSF